MPTPLYPELNQDPFKSGGVMDAPDFAVRRAAMKAQLGQPLTPYELNRLATRQSLEQENARSSSPIYGAGRSDQAGAIRSQLGPGGVDVRGYSGSMWNGTAVPIAGSPPRPNFEGAADAVLRSRFGRPPNERGDIDIADAAGVRSVTSPAAMSVPARADPDSARNPAGERGLIAPPPFQPANPSSNSVATLLRGSHLDPGVRDLGEQLGRANLDATRVHAAGASAALADRDRSDAAARTAVAPGDDGAEPSADEILRRYISAGGRVDPSILIGAAKPPKVTPQLIEVGGGRQALVGSAQLVPETKPPKPEKFEVGGKTYHIGPGNKYFDEQGNPIDLTPDEKPFTINEWLMMGKTPDEYQGYRDNFSKMKTGGGSTKAEPEKPAASGPVQVKTKEEFDKLKKGDKFIFNGKPGVKK